MNQDPKQELLNQIAELKAAYLAKNAKFQKGDWVAKKNPTPPIVGKVQSASLWIDPLGSLWIDPLGGATVRVYYTVLPFHKDGMPFEQITEVEESALIPASQEYLSQVPSKTETYVGWLIKKPYPENTDEVLFFKDDFDPLVEQIQNDVESYGKFLTVRKWVSDQEAPIEELQTIAVEQVMGISHVDFDVAYSEPTGHLWTTEALTVGGHDLVAELESAVGKYLVLEIEYNF